MDHFLQNSKKPIWDLAHGILNEGMLLLVENPSQSFSGFWAPRWHWTSNFQTGNGYAPWISVDHWEMHHHVLTKIEFPRICLNFCLWSEKFEKWFAAAILFNSMFNGTKLSLQPVRHLWKYLWTISSNRNSYFWWLNYVISIAVYCSVPVFYNIEFWAA